MQVACSFRGVQGDGESLDYSRCLARRIPGRSIKTVFLGEAEPAIRPGIESRFGIMAFSRTSDATVGLWVSV